MRTSRLVALASAMAVVSTIALWPTDAIAQAKSAAAITQAANAFVAALTPEQKAKAMFSFDDAERFVWQESPGPRAGVVLRDLSEAQRKLALNLLQVSVGDGGYRRIEASRARETVLSAQQKTPEGQALRHPDLFYVGIFGTPSTTNPWGWTFEGHPSPPIRSAETGSTTPCSSARAEHLGCEVEGTRGGGPKFRRASGRILGQEEDKGRAWCSRGLKREGGRLPPTEKRDAD